MCSDSKSHNEIPSNLLVYILNKDCKNVKIMSKNDNSSQLRAFPVSSNFDEMWFLKGLL